GGEGGGYRALHAVGILGREDQGGSDAARLGLHRFGIRQPPPAIREVLRRRLVPGEAERLSQLRLHAGERAGRRRAQSAAASARLTEGATHAAPCVIPPSTRAKIAARPCPRRERRR